MKRILTLCFVVASYCAAQAQKTEIFTTGIIFHSPYDLNEATVITKEVVSYGKVSEVVARNDKNGKPYFFINLEQKHYDNPMSIMAFQSSYTGNWESLTTLVGKTIFVSGIVELKEEYRYKDKPLKPSITINSPNQIKIITNF